MKIVNRDVFLRMPIGTVFSDYVLDFFGPLMVKGKTLDYGKYNDYVETDLTRSIDSASSDERITKMESAIWGSSMPMSFDQDARNGLFEYDQLYAIWERSDIEGLILKLTECVNEAYK